MIEKVLRISTMIAVFLAIAFTVSLVYLPNLYQYEKEKQMERNRQLAMIDELEEMSGLELLNYNNETAESLAEDVNFPQQLRMSLPDDTTEEDVICTTDEMAHTASVFIPNADAQYLYLYPIVGKSDDIEELNYHTTEGGGVVEITLNRVFEVEKTYADGYLYLDFVSPSEVYDKIIVIDAGHGGSAPGAVIRGNYEKDIDLAIVLQLKQMAEQLDVNWGFYYTRLDDSNPSLEERVELANELQADLFLSVHNNTTSSGRTSDTNGTCVLYNVSDGEETYSSKNFAQICLEEVTAALGSNSQGLVDGDDIYIVRNAQMPVALIEVGFMTNKEELANLGTEEYQKQAAQGMLNAIVRAMEAGY